MICRICNRDLPADSFGPSKQTRSGKRTDCYECRRAAWPTEYARAKAKPIRISGRVCVACQEWKSAEMFQRHGSGLFPQCRPCKSSINATWYRENKSHHLTNHRAWALVNKAKMAEYRRGWAARNKEVCLEKTRVYRGRLSAAPGAVTGREWSEIVELHGGRCAYCAAPATERDHVVPVSRGGANDASNVVPSCRSCNGSKSDKGLLQWLVARHAQTAGINRAEAQ